MSILTFEGLSTTFEALVNVSFTYFSHIFSLLVITYAQKLSTKCFLLIPKVLGTHVIVLHRAWKCKFNFLAAHVLDKDCTNYQHIYSIM